MGRMPVTADQFVGKPREAEVPIGKGTNIGEGIRNVRGVVLSSF